MGDFIQLFSAQSKPDEAFFLEKGEVYFFISEGDKYAIKGKNLIIGSTEILLNRFLEIGSNRLETAVTNKNSIIKRLPIDKFLSSLYSYSFILNVSMVIAKQVFLSNQIIDRNLKGMKSGDDRVKEIALEYYRIILRLKKEYDKRRLPWLKDIITTYETSLTFKRGEAFGRASEQSRINSEVALSDKLIEFPKDSIICEEETVGEEMYILQSGTIDVYIKGNKVVSLNETGSVFGEMALLLGTKRTATLKARSNVVLTRIAKKDLREVAEKQCDILIDVVSSLAKKHYLNVQKISSINQLLVEQEIDREFKEQEKQKINTQRMYSELLSLKNAIEEAYESHDADFLSDMVDQF